MTRHFLNGGELDEQELKRVLNRALELKNAPLASKALAGKSVGLIFQKPSTRTRISFEVGIYELGGKAIILKADELQLARGESIRDTALVLSRHVDAIGLRTSSHDDLLELAEYSTVPVFNMLTAEHHPCQILADLMTIQEAFGSLVGRKLTYVGDGNNVARSLALIGQIAGLEVRVSSPAGYQLEQAAGAQLIEDPVTAVTGSDVLYTDVWVSMGDEQSAAQRKAALAPYQLSEELLGHAASDAIVLHCLPAHPGEEITEELLYGPRQRIWDQAENRRHAQKALLEHLLSNE